MATMGYIHLDIRHGAESALGSDVSRPVKEHKDGHARQQGIE